MMLSFLLSACVVAPGVLPQEEMNRDVPLSDADERDNAGIGVKEKATEAADAATRAKLKPENFMVYYVQFSIKILYVSVIGFCVPKWSLVFVTLLINQKTDFSMRFAIGNLLFEQLARHKRSIFGNQSSS